MHNKKLPFTLLMFFLIGMFTTPVHGSVVPINIDMVKINGMDVMADAENKIALNNGESLEVMVRLTASEDTENVEVEAFISGYEYNYKDPISAYSEIFDLREDETKGVMLMLKVPENLEEDSYKLRIIVSDKDSQAVLKNYNIKFKAGRHAIAIEDVIFNPSENLHPGDYLFADVTIQNMGRDDERGIKVTMSIPELEVSASDRINEIEFDEEETTEGIYLKIPLNADPGQYDAIIEASYADGFEIISTTYQIDIEDEGSLTAQEDYTDNGEESDTVNVVGSDNMVVDEFSAATFIIALNNEGEDRRTYTLEIEGTQGWATVTANPEERLQVDSGDTGYIILDVAPEEHAEGVFEFLANVYNDEKLVKQMTLSLDIKKTKSSSKETSYTIAQTDKGINEKSSIGATSIADPGENSKEKNSKIDMNEDASSSEGSKPMNKGMQIAAIILVVLIVIIGLIIAYAKVTQKDYEEEDEEDVL